MPFLRQSTTQVVLFGPCLDKTDGVTEETGLTLAQADMRLSKDGGAFAQKSAAGNATHDSDGWYNTTLSTTDTDTVGELRLNVHQPANMLPVWDRWWVIEEAIYDALFGASAVGFDSNQRVDVGAFLGTAVAAATASGEVAANVTEWLGTAVVASTAGIPNTNPVRWNNGLIPAQGVTGVPEVDVTHFVAQLAPTPATTGVPDVNTVEFLDTAVVLSNGLPDINVEDWLGTLVTAATAGVPNVNTTEISGDATAADNLEEGATAIVVSTAKSGTLSTTAMSTNLTEATNDHYIGRTVIWTTGVLAGQASDITGYAGTNGVLTYSTLTEAPSAGDAFVIV